MCHVRMLAMLFLTISENVAFLVGQAPLHSNVLARMDHYLHHYRGFEASCTDDEACAENAALRGFWEQLLT